MQKIIEVLSKNAAPDAAIFEINLDDNLNPDKFNRLLAESCKYNITREFCVMSYPKSSAEFKEYIFRRRIVTAKEEKAATFLHKSLLKTKLPADYDIAVLYPNASAVLYEETIKEDKEPYSFDSSYVEFKITIKIPADAADWEIHLAASVINDAEPYLKDKDKIRRMKDKLLLSLQKTCTAKGAITSVYSQMPGSRYSLSLLYKGKAADLNLSSLKTLPQIVAVISKDSVGDMEYQKQIHNIAKLIYYDPAEVDRFLSEYGLKKLLNQAKSLTRREYKKIYRENLRDFYVTDKADGIRCCIYVDYDQLILVADKIYKFAGREQYSAVEVYDAELMKTSGGEVSCVLIFDKMYSGNSMTDKKFADRIKNLSADAADLADSFGIDISAKKYKKIEKPEDIRIYYEESRQSAEYDLDGLIFTADAAASGAFKDKKVPNSYYRTINLKYKPIEKQTIDFYVINMTKYCGVYPYISNAGFEMYFLCCGLSKFDKTKLRILTNSLLESWMKDNKKSLDTPIIQFSTVYNPFGFIHWQKAEDKLESGKVYEFRLVECRDPALWPQNYVYHIANGRKYVWDMVKQREDRAKEVNYFGNYYNIAVSNYENYLNPLMLDELWNGVSGDYFGEKSGIYEAANTCKRNFINLAMDKLKRDSGTSDVIMDIAAGRGADLRRVFRLKPKAAVFADIDPDALLELRERIENIRNKNKTRKDAAFVDIPKNIYIMQADLKDPFEEFIDRIIKFGIGTKENPAAVDSIICNFALHYFCDNVKNLNNILLLISKLIRPGGKFVFTVMRGADIFGLLRNLPKGGEWICLENEIKKYGIKKQYSESTIEPCGQRIDVILPFGEGKYVPEYLCNTDYVIENLQRLGFEDDYIQIDHSLDDAAILEEERLYIALHSTFIMQKAAKV